MTEKKHQTASITDSMLFIGIGLALLYWVLESFLYFFYSPDINFIQHLMGSERFGTLNRVMVLCLFVFFGSHVQYTLGMRKKAQEAAGTQQRKYEAIIEGIAEGYLETDLQGNFTFVNDAVCKNTSLEREHLLGMNYRALLSPEGAETVAEGFRQALAQKRAVEIADVEVVLPGERTMVMELSASPILQEDGKVIGFRSVSRDVTDRTRMHKEKKQLAAQLEQVQKMEAIGTLASGIANDFDHVLSGMQATLKGLMDRVDSADPLYEKMGHIGQFADNGRGLTRQLLRFARGGEYRKEPLAINELVEKTVLMFGRTKPQITIHSDYQEGVWRVEGDHGQLEQVMMNLLVNAWHAMPDGGEIFVRTRNLIIDTTDIKPCKIGAGRYVQIAVTDTGKGIPGDIQPRIFEPFFTTRESGGGTGLGLATAYGILESHGGGITVYSEPGHGSTFNIYLPSMK